MCSLCFFSYISFFYFSENTSDNAESKLEGLKEPVKSIVAVADQEITAASVKCMWVSTQRRGQRVKDE